LGGGLRRRALEDYDNSAARGMGSRSPAKVDRLMYGRQQFVADHIATEIAKHSRLHLTRGHSNTYQFPIFCILDHPGARLPELGGCRTFHTFVL
jgi:hypothetical protein